MHRDLTAVSFDDGAHQRQPQARALVVAPGREEAFEDVGQILLHDTGAVVADRDVDSSVVVL